MQWAQSLIPGQGTKTPDTATKPSHLRAHAPQLGKPEYHNEEPAHCNEDPVQPK